MTQDLLQFALYAVVLMMLFNLFSHGSQDLYPTFLQKQQGFDHATVSWITIIANIGAIVGGLFFGMLSERIGRINAITIASVIESIPRDLEDAASNLGASSLRTFWRVILPLSAPGVAAGCILVFVLCMNTYATAVLLGGPRFKMMAPAIFDQFIRGNNWPMGATLAFMLLAVTMSFTVFGSVVFAHRYRAK